ncbi:hypothetical protein VTJ49DRAFT_75 [Mycothermus thermophilus]|uniref:Protein kinase domain-containing protein n=1 Tax=Humicola insolens TaxID=85995 RepID=A0ABR3VRV5_HUMIN
MAMHPAYAASTAAYATHATNVAPWSQSASGSTAYTYRSILRELKSQDDPQFICVLLDIAYHEKTGTLLIYSELAKGGTFWDLARNPRLSQRRLHPFLVLLLWYDMILGVCELHALDILHRDLKGDNVLITVEISAEANDALLAFQDKRITLSDKRMRALTELLFHNKHRMAVVTDVGLSRDETDPSRSDRTYFGGPEAWTDLISPPELKFGGFQSLMADVYSSAITGRLLCTGQYPPAWDQYNFAPLPAQYSMLQDLVNRCLTLHVPTERPKTFEVAEMLHRLIEVELWKLGPEFQQAIGW